MSAQQPTQVAFLGPEGTFTHQAARAALPDATLVPLGVVTDVYQAVESEQFDYGIVAIESSVEGYVVPSLDALVAASNVVAIDEVFVEVAFDAMTVEGAQGPFTEVVSHPHGLAQCQQFISARGLVEVPAASNAAAARDIGEHQIALAPGIARTLYNRELLASAVQDFQGARTRFLLIASRNKAFGDRESISPWEPSLAGNQSAPMRTMMAITPRITGPGVLARISGSLGEHDVNMSSLITRPLKALEGKYTFIVTLDAAPWSDSLTAVINGFLAAGDSVKTLGVFPSRGEIDGAVTDSHIAPVSAQSQSKPEDLKRALLW